jgi:ubiquinone biosynthesis protein
MFEEEQTGEVERARMSIGERVRLVIQDLGPSFIKLGQIASTRTDLFPADVIVELKKLQDNVPPVPFDDVRVVIESSLGAKIEDLFKRFEQEPLASASIGQVHRATLDTPEGDVEVVVKVQRPNVGSIIARDVELLHIMAAAIERAIPESRIYSPTGLVHQFDRSINTEIDFVTEGDNAERFSRNFADVSDVRFPKIYKQTSSKYVLTQEFFSGKKLDRALADGADGQKIAKRTLAAIIKMIYDDGFFHADPHPGNIIIMGTNEDPIIGMIDVGMVGRLSPELRDRSVDLMIAAARKDSYAVADALLLIGKPTKKFDVREYRAEAAMLAEKYLGRPLKEIELSAMVRDLVQGGTKYGVEIPTDYMLVGKALMTVEGVGKEIYPDLDVFSEATPHFTAILRKRYSPQRLGNELWRGIEQLSRVGYDLPLQIREVLDDVRHGRLEIATPNPNLPKVADRLGRRVFSGLVISACLLSGGFLVQSTQPIVGYVILGVGATVWFLHLANEVRRKIQREI